MISSTTIASASRSVVELLPGHFAQAAHGQAGPGKRMPPDDLLGQSELQPKSADFVLEQVAQRLDQFEAQFVGQAADVVVQLDRGGRAVGRGAAFDHVGIERSLGQEVGAFDLRGLVGEAIDERVPDAAPFLLRIVDAGQCGKKSSSALTTCRSVLKVPREFADDRLPLRPCRNRPLSTRMQESCGPIASVSRAATTDESTPPDSPQITRSSPTCVADRARSSPRRSRPAARCP